MPVSTVSVDDGSLREVTQSPLPGPNKAQQVYENRDPEFINTHLRVAFEDVFAEPHETVYSFSFIWKASFLAFTFTKLWTYRIITIICAVPLAVLWGLYFAGMAFFNIWCCLPAYRAFYINSSIIKKYNWTFMNTFIAPITEAIGHIFPGRHTTTLQLGPTGVV